MGSTTSMNLKINYQHYTFLRWTWLIAPLRKWDTLTQTGRMHAIRPLEPVQIRYPKDKGVCDEAVVDSLLSQHELPVTITTQVGQPSNPLLLATFIYMYTVMTVQAHFQIFIIAHVNWPVEHKLDIGKL